MMTRRQAIAWISAAALAPRVSARDASPVMERALMGTRFAIECDHPDQELVKTACTAAFAAADQINEVASDYIADSELLSLQKHPAGTPVKVSAELFPLLKQALEFAQKTDGLFDPTLGPLTKLWRESRRRLTLPSPEILEAARSVSGWKYLTLDEDKSTATFAKSGMRLDLGGIAKGQAADAMLAVLQKYGISRISITCGGDVRLGDPPEQRKGWRVGVRTFDKTSDSRTLILSNDAVSTSGDLQQAIEIDGVRYAHIIDPMTGLGITKKAAATVIAPCAAMSDALATACCIATPERARELVRTVGATELFLP
ncbi:FAD:protein FMN transferase [Luteolibacter pohnpeiensis]|uniref:FAD:protein FMN transferase n=1 Tax=Luteolibacter pohnpeiensis TaxID=454153 RepID=A0A934S7Y0_9BACT|nr:FAD:protein FMN transferase [Luteolibacter pohnpeiensis]MBK1882869.1 FAD:protein FMN transferase [Luteolibacter pohnpeiensis]